MNLICYDSVVSIAKLEMIQINLRTWNGFAIESIEFAGNAIHVGQSSGDVTVRAIDDATIEQLLVINKEGDLSNRELDVNVVVDSDKIVSNIDPSTKWEIGNFIARSFDGLIDYFSKDISFTVILDIIFN